jgi:hypothetical protein
MCVCKYMIMTLTKMQSKSTKMQIKERAIATMCAEKTVRNALARQHQSATVVLVTSLVMLFSMHAGAGEHPHVSHHSRPPVGAKTTLLCFLGICSIGSPKCMWYLHACVHVLVCLCDAVARSRYFRRRAGARNTFSSQTRP